MDTLNLGFQKNQLFTLSQRELPNTEKQNLKLSVRKLQNISHYELRRHNGETG